ncbi:hypothetical protein F4781DRAFT_402559 [Annulohypoxylon bovei var. microspora]|nr:hypothetical protein F4781DRAFT_402559 [Annulohypoxylon bovei var. microspora]
MSTGTRPKDLHVKHLTELERFRVRTLYYDAGMGKPRIQEVTGFSRSQITTAINAKSAAVRPRSGRPKRAHKGQAPAKQQGDTDGSSSQNLAADGSNVASSNFPSQPPQEASQQQSHSTFTALSPSLPPSADPPISSS